MRQLEAEGFSREEAEHLAVTAMGHPAGTNRALLGHVFTTALGWTVLATLVIGGGGWWTWTHVPLPLPGVREASWNWSKELSSDDLREVLADPYAPRGQMLAGTLTVPPRTQWVYVALTPVNATPGSGYWSPHRLEPLPGVGPNRVRRAQVVLGSGVWEPGVCGGNGLRLYENLRWPHKRLRERMAPPCQTTLPPREDINFIQSDWERTSWLVGDDQSGHHRSARPLPMNKWTPLALYGLDYGQLNGRGRSVVWREDGKGMKAAYLYSVMPADHQMHQAVTRNGPDGTIFLGGRFGWGRDALGLPRPELNLSH